MSGNSDNSIEKMMKSLSGRPDREISFESDKLGLERYADTLNGLIENSGTLPRSNDNASYVIGLDASWGSGKTFFVSMFYKKLLGTWSVPIYYNAWKGDFWGDAFSPFFDCIYNAFPSMKDAIKIAEAFSAAQKEPENGMEKLIAEELSMPSDEGTQSIIKNAAEILAEAAKGYVTKKVSDMIDKDHLKKMEEKGASIMRTMVRDSDTDTEELFPDYSEYKKAVGILRNYLENIAKKINKNDPKGKLVILVDELDRCKPLFAVQTLEIIKHFFDVENVVFILSLDVQELAYSVKHVYGNGFDAVGYLERFFNQVMMLPRGMRRSYLAMVESIRQEVNKAEGWQEGETGFELQKAEESFAKIAEIFKLSFRELRRILFNYRVLERTCLKDYASFANARIVYFYFLTLKYKKPQLFSSAVFENDIEMLCRFLENNEGIPVLMENKEERLRIITEALKTGNGMPGTKKNTLSDMRVRKVLADASMESCSERTFPLANVLGNIPEIGNDSYSYFLYRPDMNREEEYFREFSLLEHIYQNLEMCDFNLAE